MIKRSPVKVAIASGKGGAGKTLLATNLWACLSKKRGVLLVDLDSEEPNCALFAGGFPDATYLQYKMIPEWEKDKCTLCGNCVVNCKFHAIVKAAETIHVLNKLCHSCYACSELCPENSLPMKECLLGEINEYVSADIKLVESRLSLGEEQAVPLINKTVEFVNNKYSDVLLHIIDCPPGTSCSLVASTKDANYVIIVTEATPFGLHDLKLTVETMRLLNKNFGVVVNRYGYGDSSVEEYCKAENIAILAKIKFEMDIAKYYSKGVLVYDKVESFASEMDKIEDFIELNYNL